MMFAPDTLSGLTVFPPHLDFGLVHGEAEVVFAGPNLRLFCVPALSSPQRHAHGGHANYSSGEVTRNSAKKYFV